MTAVRPISTVLDHPRHGRTLVVPGFVSAHSHAFQRGLRGLTQRRAKSSGSFWSWRAGMYELANTLTPESIYAISRTAYEELARAGVVLVGEFHYVHHDPHGTPYAERTVLADAVIRAALDAGLSITLLRVAYTRAGADRVPEGVQRRFSDPTPDRVIEDVQALRARWRAERRVNVGIAPHSVRAVPLAWIRELAAFAKAESLPLHMHVGEQQGEVNECLAEHGKRPVELLADAGALFSGFCAVHATLVSDSEAALLGAARAHACICPTTERDLGDGLADLARLRGAGVALCVGIDSHVVTDHIEEVRALETHERLRLRRRVTFEPPGERTLAEHLLIEGSAHGAQALGQSVRMESRTTSWQPSTVIPIAGQISLEGVGEDALADAVVFSGTGLRFEREMP